MAEGQPYFILLLIISAVLSFTFPIAALISPPYTYFGIFPAALGILIDLWSSAIFVRSKTTVSPYGRPTALVISGPFRISRNPMYLGMALVLLGEAMLLGSLVAFIGPLAFVLIASVALIPNEEKRLLSIFGGDYEDYRKKVRRWV